MSIQRAINSKPNADSMIILLKADKKYLDSIGSKFLLEPNATVMHRAKLAYFYSSKDYDLKNLCSIQRVLTRSLHCLYQITPMYGLCDKECMNCKFAAYNIDSAHDRITEYADAGIGISVAKVIKL